MAQEAKRGCGYRAVGAMYLVGEYIPVECDRLPYPLDVCPVCGAGIKVGRGFTKINPLHLFGIHQGCIDQHHCRICAPADGVAFIMRVGEKFYPSPGDFIKEGISLGVSKRIPFIPKELEVGKTAVYLAHKLACRVEELDPAQAVTIGEHLLKQQGLTDAIQEPMLPAARGTYKLGIFAAFTPQRVEMLVWQHDATDDKLAALEKRGITPVIIKDGDLDHAKGFSRGQGG
jgi:hypothetical protein